jgi:hypothetical protein
MDSQQTQRNYGRQPVKKPSHYTRKGVAPLLAQASNVTDFFIDERVEDVEPTPLQRLF